MPEARASEQRVRDVGRDLLALVWPTSCVACGAPDRDICGPCLERLSCENRVSPVGQASIRRELQLSSGRWVPVLGAGNYESVLRDLIVACKHAGRTGFARPIGQVLVGPLLEAMRGLRDPVIICVPSRRAKVRERGYRPVELMVRYALRALRAAHWEGLGGGRDLRAGDVRVVRGLRSRPGRTGQVGLSSAERERNARRVAVRRTRMFRGRSVILVDDIMTTGATVRAACEALEAAGAAVSAVVVAGVVERTSESAAGR